MSRPRRRRALGALPLTAALLAVVDSAAPLRPHPAPLPTNSSLGSPWDALAKLWTSLTRLWAEEGCSIDPNGHCKNTLLHPTGDNGCSIDPNGGHCLGAQSVAPASDNGCSIDPDGRCLGK